MSSINSGMLGSMFHSARLPGRLGVSLTVTALLLLGASAVSADTLLLKGGEKYENVIITGMDRTRLRFTENGTSRSIAKSNLVRIIYSDEIDRQAQMQKRDQELSELQEQISKLSANGQNPDAVLGQIRSEIDSLKSELELLGGIEDSGGVPADSAVPASAAENPRIRAQYDRLVAIAAKVERLEKVLEVWREREKSTLQANRIESELTGREIRQKYADASDRQREALLRSMILPGWGHAHTGRSGTGVALGVLFLGSVGLAAGSAQEINVLRAAYNDPLPFLVARNTGDSTRALLINAFYYGDIGTRLRAAGTRYNAAILLAGAVWAGALFHISLADSSPQVDISLRPGDPAGSDPLIGLSATIRW